MEPKVHYRIHKYLPSVPILSQIDPVHTLTSSWISILILSSHLHLGFSSGLLPSGFSTKALYKLALSLIRATCPANLNLLHFITRKILGEEYRSLSSSLWDLLTTCRKTFWIFFSSLHCVYLLNLQTHILNFSSEPSLKFLYVCPIKLRIKHPVLPALQNGDIHTAITQ